MISTTLFAADVFALGDCLIDVRGHCHNTPRMSDMPDLGIAHGFGGRLALRGPGQEWHGFPACIFHTEEWDVLLIGEVYGHIARSSLEKAIAGALEDDAQASSLNGHCVVLGWHRPTGRWTILTDRFGTVHIYHAHNGDAAAIGTCFRTVAGRADERHIDWEAVAAFSMIGFYPGDLTPCRHVRIQRPATRIVLDVDGRRIANTRYWDWQHEADASRTFAATIDAFAATWQEVVDEMIADGRIALPLSGGLDSRCAAGAAATSNTRRNLWSYSYGYTTSSIETRIAADVACAAALPFEAYTIGQQFFRDIPVIDAALEGFQDMTQARQVNARHHLRERSDAVLGAHWGDVWMDAVTVPARIGTKRGTSFVDMALEKILKKGRTHLQSLIFDQLTPHLNAEELTQSIIEKEFTRIPDMEDAAFRFTAFKTEQWSFRWTLASLRMYQSGTWTRLPFYDHRIADLMMTIPTAYVRDRRLQLEYLKRHHPALARVEWQGYGCNLFQVKHHNNLLIPKRAWRKFARWVRSIEEPASNWRHQFQSIDAQQQIHGLLMKQGGVLTSMMDSQRISSFIGDAMENRNDAEYGYALSMLMTLQLGLDGRTAS